VLPTTSLQSQKPANSLLQLEETEKVCKQYANCNRIATALTHNRLTERYGKRWYIDQWRMKCTISLFTPLHSITSDSINSSFNIIVLEKLIVSQPVKKSPSIYGNRKFIFIFTTARYFSQSRARSIQFMTSKHISVWSSLSVSNSRSLTYEVEITSCEQGSKRPNTNVVVIWPVANRSLCKHLPTLCSDKQEKTL